MFEFISDILKYINSAIELCQKCRQFLQSCLPKRVRKSTFRKTNSEKEALLNLPWQRKHNCLNVCLLKDCVKSTLRRHVSKNRFRNPLFSENPFLDIEITDKSNFEIF